MPCSIRCSPASWPQGFPLKEIEWPPLVSRRSVGQDHRLGVRATLVAQDCTQRAGAVDLTPRSWRGDRAAVGDAPPAGQRHCRWDPKKQGLRACWRRESPPWVRQAKRVPNIVDLAGLARHDGRVEMGSDNRNAWMGDGCRAHMSASIPLRSASPPRHCGCPPALASLPRRGRRHDHATSACDRSVNQISCFRVRGSRGRRVRREAYLILRLFTDPVSASPDVAPSAFHRVLMNPVTTPPRRSP